MAEGKISVMTNGFRIDNMRRDLPFTMLIGAWQICSLDCDTDDKVHTVCVSEKTYNSLSEGEREAWENYYGVKLDYVRPLNPEP